MPIWDNTKIFEKQHALVEITMVEPLGHFAIQAAIRAIQTRLNRASSAGDNWLLFDGGEWDKRTCESNLLDAWVLLVDLVARLDHGPLLDLAKYKYEQCKQSPLASDMGPDEPYLIWPGRAYSLLHMIQDLHLLDDSNDSNPKSISHLLTIIRHSEHYVTSRGAFGWLPCREEDLHQRLEGLIKCTQPDVRTKPPLAKPIKGFAPDSGIPSVNTLIEYKFIETETQGKAVLDQILADIGGYQSDAYDTFIFVVYETARLFTEGQWREAIAASKPRHRVDVVVIRGIPPTNDDKQFSEALQNKRRVSASANQKQSKPNGRPE